AWRHFVLSGTAAASSFQTIGQEQLFGSRSRHRQIKKSGCSSQDGQPDFLLWRKTFQYKGDRRFPFLLVIPAVICTSTRKGAKKHIAHKGGSNEANDRKGCPIHDRSLLLKLLNIDAELLEYLR